MSKSKRDRDGESAADEKSRTSAESVPDYHDPVELAERVNELTPGTDLPPPLEWNDDDRIVMPPTADERVCQIIRGLREEMKSVEIAAALGRGRSMVSFHLRGDCKHWDPEETVDLRGTSRAPNNMEVTATDKVVSVRRRQYYHAYSDGVPACGRTGDSYKVWHDLDMARAWKDPCSWCFPDAEEKGEDDE